MALDYRPQTTTAEQYAQIFDLERTQEYPSVDAFEAKTGFALDRDRLEDLARVLCCPFKAAPPNWQHGRVIYAAVRTHLLEVSRDYHHVDIGTAKGFSALCARLAIDDGAGDGTVDSVDVMPPQARVRRSTPAEVDGLKTLAEIVAPWAEAARVTFHEFTGIEFLRLRQERIHSAFVDGKHSTEAVSAEWRALAKRQQPGDVAIFDDIQMPPVAVGLQGAEAAYDFERLELGRVNRAYAIGVRR